MPYRPTERQYRSFSATNFRALDTEGGEPSYKVRGYFTTFNEEYLLYERTKYWPAEYEQIDRHALDDADMSDVILKFDHAGMVLARQRNGSLKVGTDNHGAWCEADLSGCEQGRNLYEAIRNGLIDEMSFAFTIESDEDGEGYVSTRDEQGDYHTTITRIRRVYDCSAVSIPANPGTDIEEARKRSYLYATIEADRKAEQEERAAQEQAAKDAEAAERARISRMRRKAKALALQSI